MIASRHSGHRGAATNQIFGREAERDLLLRAIELVRDGGKRGVMLLGDPGIGKTALLRHTIEVARDEGFVTSAVRASVVSGAPHSPVLELLEGLRSARKTFDAPRPPSLHRAIEALRGEQPSTDPRTLLPLVAEALEAIAREAPLALLVDDYYLAPPNGADFLVSVLRAVEGRFLFVGTSRLGGRGADVSSPPPAPTADLWVDHVKVAQLDPDATIALAQACLNGPVLPSLGDRVFDVTRGNPLFVEEVLRHWAERGRLVRVGEHWGSDGEDSQEFMPQSLTGVITERLAGVAQVDRHVAMTLAILGRAAQFHELQALVDSSGEDIGESLGRLEEIGVLRRENGFPACYRLGHPLHEQALLAGLASARKAALHQRVFNGFRSLGEGGSARTAEMAFHALRALEPPRELHELLRKAAEEAEAAGGMSEAAWWWEQLHVVDGHDSMELVALEGQARARTGFDARAAVDLYTSALIRANDPDVRARLLVGRAEGYRRLGSIQESLQDLCLAAETVPRERTRDIRRAIAVAHIGVGAVDEAEDLLEDIQHEAESGPGLVRLLCDLASVRYAKGAIASAIALSEQVLSDAQPSDVARHRANLSWAYMLVGRWDEALCLVDDVIRSPGGADDLWHLEMPLGVAARIRACRGELAPSLDLATQAIKCAERLGSTPDLIDALEALTIVLLEAGRGQDAVQLAARIPKLHAGVTEFRPDYAHSFVVCGEAYLTVGDSAMAADMCSSARGLVQSTAWGVAVDRLEAEIKLREGSSAEALALLHPWLAEPSVLVFQQGRVLEVAARALFAGGDRRAAAARAEEGADIWRALGAEPRLAEIGRWLDSRRPRPRGRPRSNLPADLTPRELEVLRLVVKGMTNSQIAEAFVVSKVTAKKHVQNLLRKAGVQRRTQLLAFARAVGIRVGND